MNILTTPIDPERRASMVILVAMRWLLIGVAAFMMYYRPGTRRTVLVAITLLIVAAVLINVLLQRRLQSGRTIYFGLALLAGVLDAVAITIAVALIGGFTNDTFVLYYPALLAFSLVFRGRWSFWYGTAVLTAYTLISLFTHGNLDATDPADQKSLVLRLATMAATVVLANMVVRIERERRRRAVAAEAQHAAEVLALEQRARAAERAAQEERQRLARDVHDGISQSVYMLTLGLETAAAIAAKEKSPALGERMDTLVRLSKHTLLDTRNLLFDLGDVMAGQTSLAALVRNQAQEFSAVTGIPVEVAVEGSERTLSPTTIGEVYRVIQEGLANVYKHAGADAVTLRLAYGAGGLALDVADTGRGFDPARTAGRGHGLANMRGRITRLGGRLAIEAAQGRGTRLAVTIPYTEGAHGADSRAAG